MWHIAFAFVASQEVQSAETAKDSPGSDVNEGGWGEERSLF